MEEPKNNPQFVPKESKLSNTSRPDGAVFCSTYNSKPPAGIQIR